MAIQKTVTLYTFDELSDSAKECARAWYREASAQDEFWDCIYEDAQTIAALMGIEIDTRKGGPDIRFSGFWSQGDGASYFGTYAYKPGAVKAVQAYAPQDAELHRIARELQKAQRRVFYRACASISDSAHSRHSHEMTMRIDVELADGRDAPEAIAEAIAEALRDFARWIYAQLEREYEYQNSNEVIDETMRANEYTFTDDGRRDD